MAGLTQPQGFALKDAAGWGGPSSPVLFVSQGSSAFPRLRRTSTHDPFKFVGNAFVDVRGGHTGPPAIAVLSPVPSGEGHWKEIAAAAVELSRQGGIFGKVPCLVYAIRAPQFESYWEEFECSLERADSEGFDVFADKRTIGRHEGDWGLLPMDVRFSRADDGGHASSAVWAAPRLDLAVMEQPDVAGALFEWQALGAFAGLFSGSCLMLPVQEAVSFSHGLLDVLMAGRWPFPSPVLPHDAVERMNLLSLRHTWSLSIDSLFCEGGAFSDEGHVQGIEACRAVCRIWKDSLGSRGVLLDGDYRNRGMEGLAELASETAVYSKVEAFLSGVPEEDLLA